MSPRARRAALAGALLLLFTLAVAVFVLPFAFPTPPPIVTRFQSTQLFSPNGDGRREVAQVSVRLRVAGEVTLELKRDASTVRGLLARAERPAGWVRVEWDGRDERGARVEDGTYALKLRARAGQRQFNTTRRVIVDTDAPALARLAVRSAALAGPGPGECRVAATPADSGALTIDALAADGRPLRTFGPRPARAGETIRWRWRATARDGAPLAPGLYRLRATLADTARNLVREARTCWVGHVIGAPRPARPAPGVRVGVALRRLDGSALPASTPVQLSLYERAGVPGPDLGPVLGRRVGGQARGPAGRVRLRLPRLRSPAGLWLVAASAEGRALIPLRPAP